MKAEFQEFKIEMRNEFKEFAIAITETILEGMGRAFEKLNIRMDNFEARLVSVELKVSNIEVIVTDIREELDAGLRAIDGHATMLLDHKKRIGRLEKRMA